MLASEQALPELALPPLDLRALARRGAIPALVAAAAVGVIVLAGPRMHVFTAALSHALHANPAWALLAVVFECVSLAGYVGLLWLVAGRAAPRVDIRASAQITFTGAGATRLLPTAGAGGAAVAIWALRRAGMNTAAAARTLLTFFVLLYSFFLTATAGFGAALTLGLVRGHGPTVMSAVASAVAVAAIVLSLVFAWRVRADRAGAGRLRRGAQLVGLAVRDALALVRSRDLRLVGAATYWIFDAAVLWAMLSALGSSPSLPVVALAYLLGQVANTLPIPGSVSGGMTGVLIAWGVPAELALPAVLAYRTVAVWLPTPAALGAIPGLRATVARWTREDAVAVAV